MAINDIKFEESKKPRRTRGTPSYYYRNKFAFGVIATGCIIFGIISCMPAFHRFNEKLNSTLYTRSEEEIERKLAFSFFRRKRSDEILRMLKEEEDFRKSF